MRRRKTCGGALLLVGVVGAALAAGPAGAAPPGADDGKPRPTNRLARESSPYLLQHAQNPVDWFPWGPEAFAKAKQEGKLVFLSIGYSSCHWCHVMERESFENPEVARLLNQWYVPIKVDREERPDVDTVYMTALNVTGQRGGWPLSMFLTADGRPVIGGTYWPPDDRDTPDGKARGFKSILKLVHDWAQENPKEIEEQATKVAAATRNALAGRVPGVALGDLDRELVTAAVDAVREEFDPEYGGFGNPQRKFRGTKFPTPPYLSLLLHETGRGKSEELTRVVAVTLDHMARGGIYDHLGGGFHRYSTERTWTVPHFEKMLYDNAQLAEVYAEAYRRTKQPEYRRVLRETLDFIGRELTSPDGALYSALDADSEGQEGRFYVWTAKEIDSVLAGEADAGLLKKTYGLDGPPNFESEAYILRLNRPLRDVAAEQKLTEEELANRLAPLRRKLFERRAQRPRPFLDTKVLTGWNGQMIAGYAAAGQALNEPAYLAAATRAAEFVLHHLRTPEGRLLRTYGASPGKSGAARLNAYLDDYAYFVHGLLRLQDATGTPKWLEEAKRLTDTMVRCHGDPEAGGFFYTSSDHEKLFARSKDQYDGAQPSGNSMAANNLVRLWVKTGDARYRDLAEKALRSFAGPLKANPTGMTGMAEALALLLDARDGQDSRPAPRPEQVAQAGGAKRSDAVVKVTAKADPPDADGNQLVTVTLQVENGWHVYANPPGLEDLVSVQTTVTTKPEAAKVNYPAGKLVNDPVVGKYFVYENQVAIKATVRRGKGDAGPVEVTVKFQSCNEKLCLLPATVKLNVPPRGK